MYGMTVNLSKHLRTRAEVMSKDQLEGVTNLGQLDEAELNSKMLAIVAAENSIILKKLIDERSRFTIFFADGLFPIDSPIEDFNADFPLYVAGMSSFNYGDSGFLMVKNENTFRIRNRGTKIGITGHLDVVQVSGVRDGTLDVTSSIADDIVQRNMDTYAGTYNDNVEPELIVDPTQIDLTSGTVIPLNDDQPIPVAIDPSQPYGHVDNPIYVSNVDGGHLFDRIRDNNAAAIVIGYGAYAFDPANNQGDNFAGHFNPYQCDIKVNVVRSAGIAIDYRDGSTPFINARLLECARGIVIRGGAWDANHGVIFFHATRTTKSPFYTEGNHNIHGANKQQSYIGSAGHYEGKVYDYGKPVRLQAPYEDLKIFIEQGALNSNGVGFRVGNLNPLVKMPSTKGGHISVYGDSTDPKYIADLGEVSGSGDIENWVDHWDIASHRGGWMSWTGNEGDLCEVHYTAPEQGDYRDAYVQTLRLHKMVDTNHADYNNHRISRYVDGLQIGRKYRMECRASVSGSDPKAIFKNFKNTTMVSNVEVTTTGLGYHTVEFIANSSRITMDFFVANRATTDWIEIGRGRVGLVKED